MSLEVQTEAAKQVYIKLFFRYYAAEFEQSIFDEEDSNSNCKEYTNTTYDECDKIFIKNFFLNNFEGFMPIWATENISEVTKFWNSNGSNMHSYHNIFDGTMDSGIRQYIDC